jgi:diguanylate cyclase (GGDEF)-like protein/PAS domain S-box-containing protein
LASPAINSRIARFACGWATGLARMNNDHYTVVHAKEKITYSAFRQIRSVMLSTLLYGLLALLSISLSWQGSMATVWFANAIGIVAFASHSYRLWPLHALGLAAAIVGANYLTGTSWANSLMYVPGNMVEMLVGGFLLRRQFKDAGFFYSITNLLLLFWLGVVVPVFFGSLVSIGLLYSKTQILEQDLFMHWVEGSLIGGTAVLPLAYWLRVFGPQKLIRQFQHSQLLLAVMMAVLVTVLTPLVLPFPFIYISLPLFYVAYTHGISGTVVANALVALSVCVLIVLGGILAQPALYSSLQALYYLPIMAILIPPLLLAVALEIAQSSNNALIKSERRYYSLYQSTPAMLYSTTPDGKINNVNELWLKTLGYEYEAVIGQQPERFFTPDSARVMREEIQPLITQEGLCRNIPLQIQTSAGEPIHVLFTASTEKNAQGQIIRTQAVLLNTDETVRAQLLAYHDALTQLPNRLLLNDRISQAIHSASRKQSQFAVVFLDLDYFKEINDTLGHEIGDLLLIEVAQRLNQTVRSCDTVSRLGGDEFVLLLTDLSQGFEAEQIASKIVEQIIRPYVINGHRIECSASLGLAFYPEHGNDAASLLRSADTAMYEAKRCGRNCFRRS